MTVTINFKRLPHCPTLQLTRAHDTDAGFDIYAANSLCVPPMDQLRIESTENVLIAGVEVPRYTYERNVIQTGIAVRPSDLGFMMVAPRSGYALNFGIGLRNYIGIVDEGYSNEILIMAMNLTRFTVPILKGERIAQLIYVPQPQLVLREVNDYDKSSRGLGGFGSSGLR